MGNCLGHLSSDGPPTLTNTTVQLNARVTIGGDAVRLRFDNAYGKAPSNRARLRRLRAGERWWCRARTSPCCLRAARRPRSRRRQCPQRSVGLSVLAMQDLAVSLYLPDADVQATSTRSDTTLYVATPNGGDHAAVEGADPFSASITTMPLLKSIDVRSASASGAIVAFGDSITDGTCRPSTRTTDGWTGCRCGSPRHRPARRAQAVVNEGIGGNTLTSEGFSRRPTARPARSPRARRAVAHRA